MPIKATDTSIGNAARPAGIAFLTIVIGYTLSWTLIYSKIIVPGNDVATVNNIVQNELLVRIGVLSDLAIAIASIILSWALYVMLKPIDRNISLLGLIIRLMDPIIALGTVAASFIVLQLLHGAQYSTAFTPDQLLPFVGLIFNLHTSAAAIPMVFACLGFIVFFSVLIRTKIVPKTVTLFGLGSYGLILVYIMFKVLGLTSSTSLLANTEMLFYFPSVLFELLIGFWLVLKRGPF